MQSLRIHLQSCRRRSGKWHCPRHKVRRHSCRLAMSAMRSWKRRVRTNLKKIKRSIFAPLSRPKSYFQKNILTNLHSINSESHFKKTSPKIKHFLPYSLLSHLFYPSIKQPIHNLHSQLHLPTFLPTSLN